MVSQHSPVASLDEKRSAPAPAADAGWADRLAAVLADRAAILGQLEATSARQDEAILRRDATELMALLTSRQSVVDRFVAGQPELLALSQVFADRGAELAKGIADELKAGMQQIFDGLTRVAAHDERAHQALRAAREETRNDLDRTTTSASARAAYGGARVDPRPVFADRQA